MRKFHESFQGELLGLFWVVTSGAVLQSFEQLASSQCDNIFVLFVLAEALIGVMERQSSCQVMAGSSGLVCAGRGHGGCSCCCQVHSAFSGVMWLGGAAQRGQTLPGGSCWPLRWETVCKHPWCFAQMQDSRGCHCPAHTDIPIVLLSRVSAVLVRENCPDSEHRNDKVALHHHVSWDGDSGTRSWVTMGFGKD